MGYRVKVYPAGAAVGYLARDRVVPPTDATYYRLPQAASAAAHAWVAKGRGRRATVETWGDGASVEEVGP